MDTEGRTTSARRRETAPLSDPEKTAVAPRFDEKSIRRARPAVPLRGAVERVRRTNPLVPLILAVGLVGILAGALGTYLYQRRPTPPQSAQTAAAVQDAGTETASAPKEEEEELFRPADGDLPDVAPPAPEEAPRPDGAGADGTPVEIKPAGGAAREESAGAGDEAALRAALAEWVGATNARDVGRQMQFYDSRLDAYYLSRGAPLAAVRAEKVRVFNRASSVDVRTGAPAIRFSADGRSAAMRFRKSYRIGSGGQARSGEVVQELRWRKTPQGWRIVSERDVRVLN